MLDKYIMVNESNILVGQNISGFWYCKELPAKTTEELEIKIGKVNEILNEYNTTYKNEDIKLRKKKE